MGDFSAFSRRLHDRRPGPSTHLPSQPMVERFFTELLAILFPHFADPDRHETQEEITAGLVLAHRHLAQMVRSLVASSGRTPGDVADAFFADLEAVYETLLGDAAAIHQGDPAAESVEEVIAAYPGFYAIAAYRTAHCLYRLDVPILPRLITEFAHRRTGVDIHPGARIGAPFFIDHATGIVIGETTEIGDEVKLYQGVTLGALSVAKDMQQTKRHPTIQDRVIIYSNATILGGETVIGHDSVIGGNAWITSSIEPYSTVYSRAEVHVRSGRGELNGEAPFREDPPPRG